MTGRIRSTCAREAISGTTPPNGPCSSSWVATTLPSTCRESVTTAAAVSSQVVSKRRSVECGAGSGEWGVRSAECGVGENDDLSVIPHSALRTPHFLSALGAQLADQILQRLVQ